MLEFPARAAVRVARVDDHLLHGGENILSALPDMRRRRHGADANGGEQVAVTALDEDVEHVLAPLDFDVEVAEHDGKRGAGLVLGIGVDGGGKVVKEARELVAQHRLEADAALLCGSRLGCGVGSFGHSCVRLLVQSMKYFLVRRR